MITLHESNITSFPLDNGIGVLSDAIKAYAEEEINGLFDFEMEYDSDGHLVDELKEERIIKAYAQDKLGYQLFRIYNIAKNHENDNLIVKAQHITYDLAHNFVEELKANGLTKKQVMEKIGTSTVNSHTFNITSSNNSTQSSTNLYRTNPLQMIAGMQGSVLQIWGGQIERDNFNLIMHDRRGHDDGVTVTYEKNITGLTAEFDISNLVTRIFPFVYIEATDDESERLITVTGKYIDSDNINAYNKIYIEPVDYSSDDRIDTQDKTDDEIRKQLLLVASQYFKETGNDKAKSIMEVQFAHLWETEEYKDVAPLELVGMGDGVTINHSKLKVEATAIVNYIKFDCIAMVNEEVKLGNVKARFSDSLNKIDAIEKKVEDVESNANQAIVSANGKNTTYYGPDEPEGDIKKGDLWFQVIDGEYHRTYRFDGIEWQLITDMDSYEAKQEAGQAKDRADEAYDNANIATENATEAINKAQKGFDKAIESLGESGLALEQANESFEQAKDNAEHIDQLALRIVSPNMITHDSDNWVDGYWVNLSGTTNTSENEYAIRTDKRYNIESEQSYTATSYGDYRLVISLYDESGYVTRHVTNEGSVTFTTSPSIIEFGVHVTTSQTTQEQTNPEMIGNQIKVKLERSDSSTEWTMHDPDYTNIVATQKGIQTEVGNLEDDVTTVAQIAQGLDVRVTDNEDNITNLQITSKGISGQLESVNTRLDDLDGDERNLITHLPQNWTHGRMYPNGTNRDTGNEQYIRTVYLPIKSNEDYTLTTYGDYEAYINFYTDSGNATLGTGSQFSTSSNTTFTTPNDAKFFRVYIQMDNSSDIDIDSVGTELKVKLNMGDKTSDWTPNFNDTGELVNQVQSFVHEFNVTAEGLASRITDNQDNINQLVNTVDGTQQQIGNMEGDINRITNLANTNQQQISDIDGNLNSLTQTVDATVSRIENTSGNLITHDVNNWTQGYWVNVVGSTSTSTNDYAIRTKERYPIKPNETYTFTSYGDYQTVISIYDTNGYKRRYRATNESVTFKTESDDVEISLHITTSNTTEELSIPEMIGVERRVQLERGAYSSDWQDHAEDTYSQYSQLSDAINLRVKEGDVLSQINVEANRVLIDSSDKLVLSANTTYVAGDFEIDGSANIKDASIGTAQIGTIDAAIASIINLSANSIAGGILTSQNSNTTINLNTGNIFMDRNDITFGSNSRINFESVSNKIQFKSTDDGITRSSGIGVGRGTSGRPIAYIGATSTDELNSLHEYFSGFIGVTTRSIAEGSANSINGYRLRLVNTATGYNRGMTFDWTSTSSPSISTLNPTDYNYSLGTFGTIYGRQSLYFRHYYNTDVGWLMETNYSGDGADVTLRGINTNDGKNYQIGKSSSRIRNIYLKNSPNVSSDIRLKDNVNDNLLGLDFVNNINTINYSMDGSQKIGFSAQQVRDTLEMFDSKGLSIVVEGEDGLYGMQYEQMIAPLYRGVKELSEIIDQQQNTIDDLMMKVARMESAA